MLALLVGLGPIHANQNPVHNNMPMDVKLRAAIDRMEFLYTNLINIDENINRLLDSIIKNEDIKKSLMAYIKKSSEYHKYLDSLQTTFVSLNHHIKTIKDKDPTTINDNMIQAFKTDLTAIHSVAEKERNDLIKYLSNNYSTILAKAVCPSVPLSSELWTELQRGKNIAATTSSKERTFHVMTEDLKNFPNSVQTLTWNALMKSLPSSASYDNGKLICSYQYTSQSTRKTYIIRLQEGFR